KDLVERCSVPCSIGGLLRIRDGLPIASLGERGTISGVLIKFNSGSEDLAYQRIADLEPENQYKWEATQSDHGQANVLVGRSPTKGSVVAEEEWSGRKDPHFTVALDVVEETLRTSKKFEWNLKPLFRLEMAYLLLWTSIERYASLRYHLRHKA